MFSDILLNPSLLHFKLSLFIFILLASLLFSYRTGSTNRLISWVINTYLLWRHPIKSTDGQRSIPTCPYIWPNGQGDVAKFLEGEKNNDTWRTEYGGIYRVWSGMSAEIVLTNPRDIRTAFSDSEKHTKAVNNNSGWLMGELLGQCVGLVSHSKWQNLRSILETPFLHSQMGAYIEKMKDSTTKHFETLHAKGKLDQGILNPVEDLKLLPFRIVAEILYGSLPADIYQNLEDLIPLRESLFRRVIGGGITRFWFSKFLPVAAVKDLAKFKAAWSQFNDSAHEFAVQDGSSLPITQFYKAVEAGSMKMEELLQTLDEILFANLDVTMGGISWALMFLAADPTFQAELRQEILNQTSEPGKRKEQNYFLRDSTLLASSILEASRLKPLAAFTIPQAAPTDRILGDFLIPAGSNLIVDSYALNTHNSYWGDDSTIYRPGRFLERSVSRSRYNFWRFGFGPRVCMGKYVADLIMRVLLAHVIGNYELSLIKGETSWDRNKVTWITHPDTILKCEYIQK